MVKKKLLSRQIGAFKNNGEHWHWRNRKRHWSTFSPPLNFLKSTPGQTKDFSFELLYNRVPKLSPIRKLTDDGNAEGNILEARRRQIQGELYANQRTSPPISVGKEVYFWRNNQGWTNPGNVINRKKTLN